MKDAWAISMLISGALFAGGVVTIAWERLPAWRRSELGEFRVAFAHTLRRVDRLQPALLVACIVSTIGFALSAEAGAQLAALLATAAMLVILVGSGALLVPVQRRLVAANLAARDAERLKSLWLRGHIARTAMAVVAIALVAVAAAVPETTRRMGRAGSALRTDRRKSIA